MLSVCYQVERLGSHPWSLNSDEISEIGALFHPTHLLSSGGRKDCSR